MSSEGRITQKDWLQLIGMVVVISGIFWGQYKVQEYLWTKRLEGKIIPTEACLKAIDKFTEEYKCEKRKNP